MALHPQVSKDERRTASIEWPMVKHIIFGHQIAPWLISRIVQFATLLSSSEGNPMPLLLPSSRRIANGSL